MYELFNDEDSATDRFNGFYRGVVVDNADPMESGRIKVRIYPMFRGFAVEDIPWAIMADPSMGGLSNVGGIRVPEVGAHVFVFFEGGDHRFPVYFAGAPAIENNEPDVPTLSRKADATVEAINSNRVSGIQTADGGSWDEPGSFHGAKYPNNKVFRTRKGIVIELDDTEDGVRFHVYHPSGTRQEVNNEGDKVDHIQGNHFEIILGDNNIYVKGGYNLTIDGNSNIYSKGSTTVKSDGDLTAEVGGNVTVNSNGILDITSSGPATIKAPSVMLNP